MQFSGDQGENMTNFYGAFCYCHRDAVTFYKDLLQSNKKFQSHIRVRDWTHQALVSVERYRQWQRYCNLQAIRLYLKDIKTDVFK